MYTPWRSHAQPTLLLMLGKVRGRMQQMLQSIPSIESSGYSLCVANLEISAILISSPHSALTKGLKLVIVSLHGLLN